MNERGGTCVPVVCDSTKDDDIEALFERIKQEQNGRLDILVNNAYAGVQVGVTTPRKPPPGLSETLTQKNKLLFS